MIYNFKYSLGDEVDTEQYNVLEDITYYKSGKIVACSVNDVGEELYLIYDELNENSFAVSVNQIIEYDEEENNEEDK